MKKILLLAAGLVIGLGWLYFDQRARELPQVKFRVAQWDYLQHLTPESLVAACGKPRSDEIIRTWRNGKKDRRIDYRFVDNGSGWIMMNRGESLPGEGVGEFLWFDFHREKNETTWHHEWPPNGESEHSILFFMPCLRLPGGRPDDPTFGSIN